MKRFQVLAFLFSLTLAAPAWAQPDEGMANPGCRMMGGGGMGMGHGMMGGGMGMGHGMGMQACLMGECWRDGMGDMMGGGMMGGMGGMMDVSGHGMIVQTAFREINGYQARAQALGLNDNQLQRLDSIEEALTSAIIKARADMQIAALDLRRAMSQETPDLKKAEEVINRKAESGKSIHKTALNAVSEARKLLTPEQRQKAKTLSTPGRMMPMPPAPGAPGGHEGHH